MYKYKSFTYLDCNVVQRQVGTHLRTDSLPPGTVPPGSTIPCRSSSGSNTDGEFVPEPDLREHVSQTFLLAIVYTTNQF